MRCVVDTMTITAFQSTFPRGERRCDICISGQVLRFQSTFPRGERRQRTATHPLYRPISIHVPAWGTTMISFLVFFFLVNFNPRSRVGNDGGQASGISVVSLFQSTFPRGERPAALSFISLSFLISIHVPAWGTTNHCFIS